MGRGGQTTALLAVVLLAGAATPARADQTVGATTVVPLTPPPARVWYGWQVAAVDLAALGAFIAGDRTNSTELLMGGISAYLVVSPLMHARRSGWRSLGSLALRVGLPFAGMLATLDLSCSSGHDDPGDGSCNDGGNGIIVGLVAAVFLDGVFAFDDVTPASVSAPRAATRTSSLTPTLTFNRGMPGLGLVGTF